jgi:hypothetical protein
MTTNSEEEPQQSLHQIRFRRVAGKFAICRLDPASAIPEWALRTGVLTSITRTRDQLSIVCFQSDVSGNVKFEGGWLCLKLEGPFPFSMTGVLASFIDPLSANRIPIFAISTFDTDYVLIKEEFWESAHPVLKSAGHELIQ